ncbi:cysteine--tRNA ligase [Rubinisphaera italica]|uniref:Cysteine--tRNA ligase n=1 Tax=Rubinisphaera italica TaxID=2527969 RepID=A0A5C5XMP2_9PLAN|nr:cysteine--tRNA ligase [Rubinisphaera italica]TWT64427.1 Cysteine--tRNA ligase [Rubinisphaera italica]
MAIRFYNSLTNQSEDFQPLEAGIVRMYSCGPTVYDFAHIGNFRSFLFADLIRRFLEVMGNDVTHIMNITDVGHMTDDHLADGGGEDKMEAAAKRLKEDKKSGKVPDGAIENPDDPYQVAQFFTDAFLEDSRKLGLKIAFEYPKNIPHATNHIEDMQEMIDELIKSGHAYVGPDGAVYYSVESFPKYGSLSGNTLDQLREGSGGRVQQNDQASKKHPADFLLWKPDQSHIMKWDSPWGMGYPGWHIECSVMARKLLGRDVIDIHTGGEDLIFPHHECEIAQSCGASGEDHFARFWMHARFLMVEGEKMSKSKGNFYTVRDVLGGKVTGREVHPAVLRYELIRSHYGSNMNFTEKGLKDSAAAVRKLNEFNAMLEAKTGGEVAEVDNSHPVLAGFLGALSDNLNISGALGVLFPWMSGPHENPQESLAVLRTINRILDVAPMEHAEELQSESSDAGGFDPAELCKGIDEARANKDYGRADELRNQLQDAGYEVRNSLEGTIATKQLA